MPSRGSAVGLNYEISPFQQQQAAPQQGIAPVQGPDAPQIPNTGLANIEGATSQLFNNYALLKSYMSDMARKGIHVDEPDYSQPDGGLPYQTFLKLDAGVRMASNKLANEQKNRDRLQELIWTNKAGYAPGFNPDQGYVTDPGSVVSYEPTYQVKEANDRLDTPTYTQLDSRAFNQAYMGPTEADIDAQVASGQITPAQGVINKSMLFQNVPQTAYQQLIPRNPRGNEDKTQGALQLLKAVTNQSGGNWSPGTFTQQLIKGKRYNVSNQFAGTQLGETQTTTTDKLGNQIARTIPIIIKDWIQDPETGSVTIRFTDSSLPDRQVDANSGEELTTTIMSSNPKFGGSAAVPELYDKMKELGFLNQTNQLIPETQVTNPEIGKAATGKTMGDAVFESNRKKVRKLINDTSNKIASFKLPSGGHVKFDRNEDDGLYLYNWKELGFNKDNKPTNLSEDEVMDYLTQYGYFKTLEDKYLKGTQQPLQNPEQAKRAADIKAKYGIK